MDEQLHMCAFVGICMNDTFASVHGMEHKVPSKPCLRTKVQGFTSISGYGDHFESLLMITYIYRHCNDTFFSTANSRNSCKTDACHMLNKVMDRNAVRLRHVKSRIPFLIVFFQWCTLNIDII